MKRRLGKVFPFILALTLLLANMSLGSFASTWHDLGAKTNGNPKGDVQIASVRFPGYNSGWGDNQSLSGKDGSSYQFTAVAATGYHFVKWTNNQGPNEIHSDSFTITATRSIQYVAHFEKDGPPPDVTITGVSEDLVKGSVTGTATVPQGTSVTLVAIPEEHYSFSHWESGGSSVSGGASLTVTATEDKTYTAYFNIDQVTITGVTDNVWEGYVSSAGTDDFISGSTSITVDYGTTVDLNAMPWPVHIFEFWSFEGNPISGGPTLSVVATVDQTYMAHFGPWQPPVPVVDVIGQTSDDAMGLVDGVVVSERLGVPLGSSQTFVAAPTDSDLYEFVNWTNSGGSEVGTDPSLTVSASNETYTAHFRAIQVAITGVPDDGSHGSVTGSDTVDAGSDVTLTANPALHYTFSHWEDEGGVDVGSSLSLDLLYVLEDATYTAHFDPIMITITGVPDDSAHGSVSGSDTVLEGSDVTLTANPGTHYHFVNWTDATGAVVGTSADLTLLDVDADATYTAHFEPNVYTVTAVSADVTMGTAGPASTAVTYPGSVEISASPLTGYKFSHWTRNGVEFTGNTNPILMVYPTDDEDYVAYFTQLDMYHVTLVPDENGGLGGNETIITLDPATGITDGFNNFTIGSVLTFSYIEGPEFEFIDWLGIPGNTITVSEDAEYIGDFDPVYYNILTSLNIGGAGSVIVNSSPVLKTHSAQVIATFNPGYAFVEFIDLDTGLSLGTSPVLDLTPTRDMNILAVYSESEIPPGPGPEPEPEPEPEPIPEDIPEEPIPEDVPEPEPEPEPEPQPEPEEEILDEDIPEDVPLPQTAGIPASVLFLAGSAIAGLGVKMRKNKRK